VNTLSRLVQPIRTYICMYGKDYKGSISQNTHANLVIVNSIINAIISTLYLKNKTILRQTRVFK